MNGLASMIREKFQTHGYYYSAHPMVLVDNKNLSIKITFNSKNYIIHLAYRLCSLNIPDDCEKVFILYTGDQAPFRDSSSRKARRQINCRSNWSNLEAELVGIVSYIDQNK